METYFLSVEVHILFAEMHILCVEMGFKNGKIHIFLLTSTHTGHILLPRAKKEIRGHANFPPFAANCPCSSRNCGTSFFLLIHIIRGQEQD